MKVGSAYDSGVKDFGDDSITAALDNEQRQAASNGPLIGLIVMASICVPLLGMAGLKLRQNQVTATPASAQVQTVAAPPVAAAPAAPVPPIAAPGVARQEDSQYIRWNTDFQVARQEAMTGNKSIMISFYTDWCPSCKSLDAEVYSDPKIVEEAQNIVPLKINAEGQSDLARQYGISKYPTIVWTDSAGREKNRQVGGSDPYYFLNTMVQNR